MRKAVLISFVTKYANIFLQIIYNAILARILTPNDFGIVAILSVFTAFFSILTNIGLGPAIIQHKDLSKDDVNNIYTFSFYVGLFLMLAFALFSIPISWFYGDKIYLILGPIISVSLLFSAINMVPNALLYKQKQFLLIGLRRIVVTILSSVVTIILALYGFRYYALAVYSVMNGLFLYIWNRMSVDVTFYGRLQFSSIVKVRTYSSFQFAFNLVNYFSRHLDNLLIGKYFSAASLGFYDKGYRLMQYPVRNLTHVITPVLHPFLSDYQKENLLMYKKYMRVVKLLSVLGAFITPVCYFAAPELIQLFFGSQWGAAVPAFEFLALSIWAQMIGSSSGSIFQSLGKTNLLFISGIINTVLNISFIVVGILKGSIESVALFVAVSYNLQLFITFFILMEKGFHVSFLKFLQYIWKDVAIMFSIGFLLYIISSVDFSNQFLSGITKVVTAGIVYVIGIFVTGQKDTLLSIIKKRSPR